MTTTAPLLDYLIVGTDFRALVIHTGFSMCAYIGVPKSHWLSNMEDLQFDCHWGVTFSGEGDGQLRPEGWYWYGWDYAHYGDHIAFPEGSIPPQLAEHFNNIFRGKKWTLAEVEQDVLDAAINLSESMRQDKLAAEMVAKGLLQTNINK